MTRTLISQLLKSESTIASVLVKGWVRTRRDAKGLSFIELNDGSCLASLQAVLTEGCHGYQCRKDMATGAALELEGELRQSQGLGQRWELEVRSARIIGYSGPEFPLQKKRHSEEFLREIAHLRARTNRFGAMFRIRSQAAFAIHSFFRERGFFYVHTPILTGIDCEGAGEMFQVGLDVDAGDGRDGLYDFFGKKAALTVSGQLEAELLALALDRVYTFGPAFRAENSNTPRHAAEFWMIEPEAAFFDLFDDMLLAEDMVKWVTDFVLRHSGEDLSLFDRFVEPGLIGRLRDLTQAEFARVSYAEAVDILSASGASFQFPPAYGSDLATEHERYLTDVHFKGPVFVHDWPALLKPFYMRLSDDGQTVAAMDLLVPKAGELIGGSQREERLDVLERRMDELGLSPEEYWWYLDTRQYGSVPHSGFGLGFERYLMMLTGTGNIRDVIPFPRTPGSLGF
jgi:asparaginyl-tRNA synthetase